MHSEVCPLCGGTGLYKEYQNYSSITYLSKTCHGCKGKGWISVPNEQKSIIGCSIPRWI